MNFNLRQGRRPPSSFLSRKSHFSLSLWCDYTLLTLPHQISPHVAPNVRKLLTSQSTLLRPNRTTEAHTNAQCLFQPILLKFNHCHRKIVLPILTRFNSPRAPVSTYRIYNRERVQYPPDGPVVRHLIFPRACACLSRVCVRDLLSSCTANHYKTGVKTHPRLRLCA